MNNVDSLDPYKLHDPETMKAIWEPRKEYIEKDLWVIRNFLSTEEIAWLENLAKTTTHWYNTMRSPYGNNTRNHFIGYLPVYDDNGVMDLSKIGEKDHRENTEYDRWGINDRLRSVVPETFAGAGAFQSFFEVPDDQIIAELGHNVDYAMDYHYEVNTMPEAAKPEDNVQTGQVSIYINTDFDGGILEFKNKEYSISPEAGMLVNVPVYSEFEHRVTKVTNGNRHTLYGQSWLTSDTRHVSTNEDC